MEAISFNVRLQYSQKANLLLTKAIREGYIPELREELKSRDLLSE